MSGTLSLCAPSEGIGRQFAESNRVSNSTHEWTSPPEVGNFTANEDRWPPAGEAIVVIRMHPWPFLGEHGLETPPSPFAGVTHVLSHATTKYLCQWMNGAY